MTGLDPAFAPLKARLAGLRYLMVVPIPWHRDGDGVIWLDPLWQRDLERHLEYLSHLTVLAPPGPMADGLVPLSPMPEGLRFAVLPQGETLGRGLMRIPGMARAGWAALGRADVFHTGAAGWPIPPGMVLNPLAALRGVPMVMSVESAFWRGDGRPRGWRARAMGAATERLARWSARRAALCVFTHRTYAEELGKGARGQVLVTPASWIDATTILTEDGAQASWDAKPTAPRILLAARLIEAKGILTALSAVAQAGGNWTLDIIGDGPLSAEVAKAAAQSGGRLRLLAPVAYGAAFFSLLEGYHAVLVPSLSDEQPRILYDAFARAVPVIASDTIGHREAVLEGETGHRFPPGDAPALAALLDEAALAGLRKMGLRARNWVGGRTHQAMHLARATALADIFSPR
jgi:glycosyltransferase involved in cell wall biosynthesis